MAAGALIIIFMMHFVQLANGLNRRLEEIGEINPLQNRGMLETHVKDFYLALEVGVMYARASGVSWYTAHRAQHPVQPRKNRENNEKQQKSCALNRTAA